jgi:uncharacterized membrane protein
MSASVEILLLWAVFAATHMGLSSTRLRPRIVARIGEAAFMGIYSLVALAIFVPLVGCYFDHKHDGPLLWSLGGVPGLRALMYIGMGFALSLLVSGLARPSPASMAPGRAEVDGVLRVTRHPLFMAAGLYGVLHLLVARVNLSELMFFGGFTLFALAGCRHQDQRKLVTSGPEFRKFHDETSFLPGARGGLLLWLREQPIPVAIGIGLTILLRVQHTQLFGG